MLQSQQMQNRQLQDQIQQLQAMQTKVQQHQASVARTLQHQQLQQQQEVMVLQPSPVLKGSVMKYVDNERPIAVSICNISTSTFQEHILAERHLSRSRGPDPGRFRPAAEPASTDAPSGVLFICLVVVDCITDGTSSTASSRGSCELLITFPRKTF